jgi:CHAT domain-containing protein
MKGVRDLLLDYALRIAQWPDERFGTAQQVRSAAVSCLLVGSGAGGIGARDSLDAILRAAVAANAKLVQARLENRVVIDRIEVVELFEDIALGAAEALHAVLSDGELATAVSWPAGVIDAGEGGRRRVRFDGAPDWWQRLEIIEDDQTQRLRFIATTDRARAEVTLATGQLRLAESFIRQAASNTSSNAEVAKTLFEMLLPNRMKELAPKQADLVLLVDPASARFPWELLEDRWGQSRRPAAVAAGLVRQLKTPQFRPHPAHASERTALVVGNPDLAGWEVFADLPGAREEARKVSALLGASGYRTLDCIDEKADAIMASLHRDAWRILHLAGHGEHEFPVQEPAEPPTSGTAAPTDTVDAVKPDPGQSTARKTVSGMVIGRNAFLTPGDVEQMRWVPELVFINCCHLGKTQTGGASRTARAGELNRLAANLAVQFIEMGVKAVVAAGWAVDDAAGAAFAETFYRRLLAGEMFGEAVRAAREDIWVRFPDCNTWGAYQCYGDPGFRLHGNGAATGRRIDRRYHAPAELVADIDNYAALIRVQVRDPEEDSVRRTELRSGLLDILGGVPESLTTDWLQRGDVAAALGLAWGEAGDWAQAVEWLDKAVAARVGDCPVRAVEQCANFRVRLSGERWRALRAQPDDATAGGARRALIGDIERAIRELDLICQRSPTAERLALLGDACKRLAWLHEADPPRIEALVNMANYYHQAHDLDRQHARATQTHPDAYPFSHWVVAKVLAELFDPRQDKDWRAGLVQACGQMMAEAEQRNQDDPNFWNAVGVAHCDLARLLLDPGRTPKAASDAATRIAGRYRSAAQRGASPRQYDSVREHVEFVQALVEAGGGEPRLRSALATLRAAL